MGSSSTRRLACAAASRARATRQRSPPLRLAHRLQLTVAAQSEAGQQVAALLLVELPAGRADSVHGRLPVVQLGQLLVEVARHDALAKADHPGVGLLQAQEAPQQRRLAGAVGPQDGPTLAAQDLKVDAGKERLLVGLGELHGSDHDVAGAGRRGKAHRRGTDFPRRRHELDPLQFLAAVFRLGVLLAVMMAADELLRLGNLDLLLFISPLLDQQPLGLLLPIGGEIAAVALDRAAEQLQRAIGHAVEEAAIMADQEQGRRAFQQEILEPLGGFDVQVVGGLVHEHQVRLGQQEFGQHEAVLLAAAKRLDRLGEAFRAESQAVQHALDLVLQLVGVAALELVLQVVVAVGQLLVLGRIGRSRPWPGRRLSASSCMAIRPAKADWASSQRVRPGAHCGCCSR